MEPWSPPSATGITRTGGCWWCSPLGLEDEQPDEDFIALDNTHAGIGDTVLVNREGNGARQVLNNPDACVISVIVGIVDSAFLE